eukprot:6778185-Pyramimonas_sp.AAC.1
MDPAATPQAATLPTMVPGIIPMFSATIHPGTGLLQPSYPPYFVQHGPVVQEQVAEDWGPSDSSGQWQEDSLFDYMSDDEWQPFEPATVPDGHHIIFDGDTSDELTEYSDDGIEVAVQLPEDPPPDDGAQFLPGGGFTVDTDTQDVTRRRVHWIRSRLVIRRHLHDFLGPI